MGKVSSGPLPVQGGSLSPGIRPALCTSLPTAETVLSAPTCLLDVNKAICLDFPGVTKLRPLPVPVYLLHQRLTFCSWSKAYSKPGLAGSRGALGHHALHSFLEHFLVAHVGLHQVCETMTQLRLFIELQGPRRW